MKAAEVLRNYQQIKFLIYGDGEDRQSLEQYCKENDLIMLFLSSGGLSQNMSPLFYLGALSISLIIFLILFLDSAVVRVSHFSIWPAGSQYFVT